ncbi:MAG: methyltransferase domain-containing protein [Ignavibacteria bacterium]|nr:methyltransferase domain-containing protein [Ignavibacteria bacterium]
MVVVLPTKNKEELRERIINAVQDLYAEVACKPSKEFHFPTGRPACEYVGYPTSELDRIPETALESFAGVGYPFAAEVLESGMTILDIGSGSGTDLINAALRVGPGGTVFGVDLTTEMIEKGEENLKAAGITNAEIKQANAESLPFPDASIDVVTSNGVLNLVPDKKTAFSEIFRVLKPGGKIQISDIVLAQEISEKSKANPQLWAECIVGAIPEEAYIELIRDTGFPDVEIVSRIDYFDGSASDSTKNAARQFGATSITLRGTRK